MIFAIIFVNISIVSLLELKNEIKLKIKGHRGLNWETSLSAVENSLIKNVNKSHYPYFLMTLLASIWYTGLNGR